MKLITYFAIFLLAFPTSVFAEGQSTGGTIVHIASVGDAILFKISGNAESDRPSCASTKRFAIHKDSAHVSVVLTAFATGKRLAHVKGTGTCSLWGNSEDVRWIEVCPLDGCEA